MKKTLRAIVLTLLVSISFAHAQQGAVKLNLLGLAFNNLSGSFEYVISENQSIILEATYKIPGDFAKVITNNSSGISTSEISGFAIRPEYRMYASRNETPKGFYFAPYLNYNQSNLDFTGTYEGEAATGTGKFTAVGPGIQIGTQWVIADRVVLDWNFLGVSLNRYKLSATVTPDNSAVDLAQFNEDIVQSVTDIPIIGKRVEKRIQIDEASNTLSANIPFWFAGLRTGFSVGVLF